MMKKKRYIMALVGAALALSAWAGDPRAESFNEGWRFTLGDDAAYAKEKYDDGQWRALSLPHDWAIEGDFSQDNPSGTGGGALPGGIGWYRKAFTLPVEDKGKQVYVDFDGAYMNSTVYVNGHELGTRPYGYASFSYDITPYVRFGKKNVIAVRVDNAEQPNSRWYSGCGIYRNVWLRVLNPLHVAQWGTYIITPDIHHAVLQVSVDATMVPRTIIEAVTDIYDPQGRCVASDSSQVVFDGQRGTATQRFDIKHPQLWSTATPVMYSAVTRIIDNGQTVDTYRTPFGIRTFEFDAERGFSLNGQPMKINGVCQHHDLGALGAAINTRALERQLEILREMGVNAIRCSHNPPAPELLDLCDRMGLLVMDETFDMWRKRKTSHDYSRYFDQWHERDLTDLVVRDRNHPSVIMWSIGNEVLEQWDSADADTLSLEEANMILNFGHAANAATDSLNVNGLLALKLYNMVKELDPTRPVTAGCNEPEPWNNIFRADAVDIIGYNYHDDWFKDVPAKFPGKPFIISESVSSLQTRGYYRMPADSLTLAPVRWDVPYYDPTFMTSAYDNFRAPWGAQHQETMRHVKNNDFISGQFIWTGFDYIGEPTPYGWPARSSYFGIVDLAGFPKDQYYMYQSEWRPDKQVLHLLPHWNWEPGQEVDVWCYYNNADEVELYVNGVSQGVRSKGEDDYHVAWRVPFEAGELLAVARQGGKEVARDVRLTAGEPYAVRLTPDRSVITADGRDLSFVTVDIVDKDGNLCPWAENEVTFSVNGAGFNAGVDNGSPISLERFKADKRKAFFGKALLIVQSDGRPGAISVTASSPGLTPATAKVSAH